MTSFLVGRRRGWGMINPAYKPASGIQDSTYCSSHTLKFLPTNHTNKTNLLHHQAMIILLFNAVMIMHEGQGLDGKQILVNLFAYQLFIFIPSNSHEMLKLPEIINLCFSQVNQTYDNMKMS